MTAPAKGPGSRFVEVPADRLVAELEAIGEAVVARGGDYAWGTQGRERIFDLTVPGSLVVVRVYTSLSTGARRSLRECGEDAVRIVVGTIPDNRFRPVEKGQKILRTAPQQGDRVAIFLGRLRESLRKAYARAKASKPCPECGRPMALRKGRHGAFLGCTGYPVCDATAPAPRG